MKNMAKSAPIWAAIVAMMIVLDGSAMAQSAKILVPADQDQASRDLGATFWNLAWSNAWNLNDVSKRSGSGILIRNNSVDGAWILTAGHAVTDSSREEAVFPRIIYGFGADSFDQFDNGVFLEADLVFVHPDYSGTLRNETDLALVRLESLAVDDQGELIAPIEFYEGPLNYGQEVLIAGYGDYGNPEQGGPGGTGQWDGFARAARGSFVVFYPHNPSVALMKYDPSIPLAGIIASGDSGGFSAIEVDGVPKLIGVNVIVVGNGTNTKSGAEYIPPGSPVLDWIDTTIALNQVDPGGEGEGEGSVDDSFHRGDIDGDWRISLSELLRIIQFFNSGGYHCAEELISTEDGYVPGSNAGSQACTAHSSDYAPQDWSLSLSELLRSIQFFNSSGYHACPEGEDGYCPGLLPAK